LGSFHLRATSPHGNSYTPRTRDEAHTQQQQQQQPFSSQHPFEIMEDDMSTGGASWAKRISWMIRKQNSNTTTTSANNTANDYNEIGAALSADSFLTDRPSSPSRPYSLASPRPPFAKDVVRSLSHLTRSSDDNCSKISVEDFNDTEWTPQDSAYGAACPVCGCLPKNVRRAIEVTLIACFVFGAIYLIITTSIRLTNDHQGQTSNDQQDSTHDKYKLSDDDYYIEYNNGKNKGADEAAVTEDDYFDDAVNANDDAARNDDPNKYQHNDDYYAASDDGQRRRYLRMSVQELLLFHNPLELV
jgi:hypothetical protein